MKQRMRIGQNPSFDSVTGLTNRTFNAESVTEGQMVTEEQLLDVYERIVEDERRADACCRDIVFWEARVQVVQLNTLSINSQSFALQGGGMLVSSFEENVNFGSMRRGLPYTVTFPIKWDDSVYVARNVAAYGQGTNPCNIYSNPNMPYKQSNIITVYRIVEDNKISVTNCNVTSSNYAGFWYGAGASLSDGVNNNIQGHIINSQNIWGVFDLDLKEDGTVRITDKRRKTDVNIIRFYTQWILRETADGQMIPDPE